MEKDSLVQTEVLSETNWRSIIIPALLIVLIILAGVGAGYFLRQGSGGKGGAAGLFLSGGDGGKAAKAPGEAGTKDEQEFPDKSEGRIEVNDGELVSDGSHKLVRPGGESKTAYLTSSVVDLDRFVGHCVEVWGQTFASQKAGWLMDIGYVRRLDQCPEGI